MIDLFYMTSLQAMFKYGYNYGSHQLTSTKPAMGSLQPHKKVSGFALVGVRHMVGCMPDYTG